MKWIAATVTFDSPDRELATDLIADQFYALDLKGVVVDDPDMDPAQDWGEDAIRPPKKPGVTGYFADTPRAADKCKALEAALLRLERTTGIASRVAYSRHGRTGLGRSLEGIFLAGEYHRHHRGQALLAGIHGRTGGDRRRDRPGHGLRHRHPSHHGPLHRHDPVPFKGPGTPFWMWAPDRAS